MYLTISFTHQYILAPWKFLHLQYVITLTLNSYFLRRDNRAIDSKWKWLNHGLIPVQYLFLCQYVSRQTLHDQNSWVLNFIREILRYPSIMNVHRRQILTSNHWKNSLAPLKFLQSMKIFYHSTRICSRFS